MTQTLDAQTLDTQPHDLDDPGLDGTALPELGANRAGIPGGCGAVAPAGPIVVHGVTWEPIDFSPWHSPIGAQIAAERHEGFATAT